MSGRQLRQRVEAELVADPAVDDVALRVTDLDGAITLSGTVPRSADREAAATAVRRVGGVTQVHDQITVALPIDEYRDDAGLTAAANRSLATQPGVPAGAAATARDGVVTLTGTATHAAGRTAATTAVTGLYGVRAVRNDLVVSDEAAVPGLAASVRVEPDDDGLVPEDSVITVSTEGRTATL